MNAERQPWRTFVLVSALAASASACEFLDPARYEYSTAEGFSSITLAAAEEASGPTPGLRRVSIRVANLYQCLPACSEQESETCVVTPEPDGSMVIEFSARIRSLVDRPGWQPVTCGAVCAYSGGYCGEVDWPDGEPLRFRSADGMEYAADPDAPLPVELGIRW